MFVIYTTKYTCQATVKRDTLCYFVTLLHLSTVSKVPLESIKVEKIIKNVDSDNDYTRLDNSAKKNECSAIRVHLEFRKDAYLSLSIARKNKAERLFVQLEFPSSRKRRTLPCK